MITMTPKNIMAKFLAVPIYSTSGIIALFALLFIIPGGIALVGALLLCWLADRLTRGKYDEIDTTIEEYEEFINTYVMPEDRDQVWRDFYDEEKDA